MGRKIKVTKIGPFSKIVFKSAYFNKNNPLFYKMIKVSLIRGKKLTKIDPFSKIVFKSAYFNKNNPLFYKMIKVSLIRGKKS